MSEVILDENGLPIVGTLPTPALTTAPVKTNKAPEVKKPEESKGKVEGEGKGDKKEGTDKSDKTSVVNTIKKKTDSGFSGKTALELDAPSSGSVDAIANDLAEAAKEAVKDDIRDVEITVTVEEDKGRVENPQTGDSSYIEDFIDGIVDFADGIEDKFSELTMADVFFPFAQKAYADDMPSGYAEDQTENLTNPYYPGGYFDPSSDATIPTQAGKLGLSPIQAQNDLSLMPDVIMGYLGEIFDDGKGKIDDGKVVEAWNEMMENYIDQTGSNQLKTYEDYEMAAKRLSNNSDLSFNDAYNEVIWNYRINELNYTSPIPEGVIIDEMDSDLLLDAKRPNGRGHAGIDLKVKSGTEVMAITGGIVVDIHEQFFGSDEKGYAAAIAVMSPDGSITRYTEIDQISGGVQYDERFGMPIMPKKIEVGTVIAQGTTLGTVSPLTEMVHIEFYSGASNNIKYNKLSHKSNTDNYKYLKDSKFREGYERRPDLENPKGLEDIVKDQIKK